MKLIIFNFSSGSYAAQSYAAPSYASYAQPSYSYAGAAAPQSYAVAAPSYAPAPAPQQSYVSYRQSVPEVYTARVTAHCNSPGCVRTNKVAAVVEPEPVTFVQPSLSSQFVRPAPSAVVETVQAPNAEAPANEVPEAIAPSSPAAAVIVQPEEAFAGSAAPETTNVVEAEQIKPQGESYQIEVVPPPVDSATQEETFVDKDGNRYRRVRYFRKVFRSRYHS